MLRKLSGICHLTALAVLAALFAVIDVASRALGEQLQRVREARGLGLSWIEAVQVARRPAIAGGAPSRRYQDLVQKRLDLTNEGKALLAKAEQGQRALSTEEADRDDAIHVELVALGAEITRWERQFEREAAATGGQVEVVRDLAGEKPWKHFGDFLQAVHRAHSGGGMDPRLMAVATGMGEATGPDGGFAVPMEFAAGIEKEMWETGQILSRVNERPIAGNAITFNVIDEKSRADGSRRGGVLGYWVDEGTAPTATQVKLAQVEMKLRKVAALGYMTDELQADAPALAAELTEAFTEELQFQVENAIVRGTGAGQPLGILNAAALVSIAKETGQAANTIVTENLSKMWARLPARSKLTAVWLINVDTEPQLDHLAIAVGTGGLEPRFVTYGPDGILRIKGRPVIPVEYAETLGTKGDILLTDLSRYRLIRKASGIETASSIHVRFTQGENTFRAIYRVDGQPLPREAITPFKGTNKLSPFVSLDTRA
ncbi:MAG: phage major capsid protein [Candidatus Rokubacteria bacterium]|nr:phage major capsid protein [Candidatus Rokubacteria bacterium]